MGKPNLGEEEAKVITVNETIIKTQIKLIILIRFSNNLDIFM